MSAAIYARTVGMNHNMSWLKLTLLISNDLQLKHRPIGSLGAWIDSCQGQVKAHNQEPKLVAHIAGSRNMVLGIMPVSIHVPNRKRGQDGTPERKRGKCKNLQAPARALLPIMTIYETTSHVRDSIRHGPPIYALVYALRYAESMISLP